MSQSSLIASRKTPVQRIDLEILPDGEIALFLDRCIQFVSGQDDAAYHGTLADLPLSMLGRRPVRALILGGGDGLAARNLLRHRNVREVVLVEIDAGMVDFCSDHPLVRSLNEDAFADPRLRTVIGDAREFVAAAPKRPFDLVVADFPDPDRRFLDLFQEPFYRRAARHLAPHGVISVQASAAGCPVEGYVGRHLAAALGRPVSRARFRGRHMEDGAVVIGGGPQAVRTVREQTAAALRWPRPLPPLTIASMSE